MAYTIQPGSHAKPLRAEVVDAMVKQIAKGAYKFKQALAVVPTSAWKNTFYREDTSVLAGQTGNAIKGVPRGAAIPQMTQKWEEVQVRITPFKAEENLIWEDLISGEIDVQARTIVGLTDGVTKAMDDYFWDSLTENYSFMTTEDLRIQSFALSGALGDGGWDESSAAIIDNLMYASELISRKNYDVSDLICFVNPRDKRSIMKYLVDKGAQFPSIATEITRNGQFGRLAGINLIESNSVATSYALVVKPKTCATYKELVPLTSVTIEDPLRSLTIRLAAEGVVEVTDPLSIVLIKRTQSASSG